MGRARSVLRGELATFSLATLLNIVEIERRGGMLVLTKAEKKAGAREARDGGHALELGRLYLRDGRIVRARIEGRRRAAGAQAVFELLSWSEGQFELWQASDAEPTGRDEITHSISYLLMEGMRRLDEARQRAAAVSAEGDAAAVP